MTEIPTFYLGDTIHVELGLRDENGLAHVIGVFAHMRPGAFSPNDPTSKYEDILLRGNGEGQAKAKVIITSTVSKETASGEYLCRYIQAHNTQGDSRMFHPEPEIRFRVDSRQGNREGPELSHWRFADTNVNVGARRPWWRRLLGG